MELSFIVVLMVASGLFVAWNTGANDAANCIGAAVGANIISFRKAAVLLGVCVFLGAILAGSEVMETTGSGMVITNPSAYEEYHGNPPSPETVETLRAAFPRERLPDAVVMLALLSAGLSVLMATLLGLPLSTSQCIVGAVAGAGIATVGFQAQFYQTSMLVRILGSWVVSPVLTLAVGFVAYRGLIEISKRVRAVLQWERVLALLVLLSSAFFAYSLGANAFGAGLGPLVMRFPEQRNVIAAVAGIVLALGAYTFGRRVTKTVGSSVARLDYAGALAAQLGAAIGLQVFSQWGVPVSSSQAIVGAVAGVGLVKGGSFINRRKVAQIFLSWVLSPAVAALLTALLHLMIFG